MKYNPIFRHGLIAVLGVAIISLQASTSEAQEKRKPNFIVIYTDNLGYGDIEPFGSKEVYPFQCHRRCLYAFAIQHHDGLLFAAGWNA